MMLCNMCTMLMRIGDDAEKFLSTEKFSHLSAGDIFILNSICQLCRRRSVKYRRNTVRALQAMQKTVGEYDYPRLQTAVC